MNRSRFVAVALIALLLNKPSLAQEFPAVPPFFRDLSKAGLLGFETVQSDLVLTDEQIQNVRGITESARRTDLTGLLKVLWPEESPAKAAEDSKRLAAYAKEVEKKLQDVLTANQLVRLNEIYVQAGGVERLFDPTIVSKLGLSDDQTAKLAEVRKKYSAAHHSWYKSRPELRTADVANAWREHRPVIIKEFEDAALSSLTVEQRDQFKKLRGKPIDLSGETLSSRRD